MLGAVFPALTLFLPAVLGSDPLKWCPDGMFYEDCASYPLGPIFQQTRFTCDYPDELTPYDCLAGCMCNRSADIVKFDDNSEVTCVSSRDDCCSGGQIWRTDVTRCDPTCDRPNPNCVFHPVSRCACPPEKPYLEDGLCTDTCEHRPIEDVVYDETIAKLRRLSLGVRCKQYAGSNENDGSSEDQSDSTGEDGTSEETNETSEEEDNKSGSGSGEKYREKWKKKILQRILKNYGNDEDEHKKWEKKMIKAISAEVSGDGMKIWKKDIIREILRENIEDIQQWKQDFLGEILSYKNEEEDENERKKRHVKSSAEEDGRSFPETDPEKIYAHGCWYITPSEERCIFSSPCPKSWEKAAREANRTEKCTPRCKECEICTCVDDGNGGEVENCINSGQNCTGKFLESLDHACWTDIENKCSFAIPCPESTESPEECERQFQERNGICTTSIEEEREAGNCGCHEDGIRSCKQCHACECLGGERFCNDDRGHTCPDPTNRDEGCNVVMPDGSCAYKHPCPSSYESCNLTASHDIFSSYCYRYSKGEGRCEFISPCPGCCREDEVTECNSCNECRCNNGLIECEADSCNTEQAYIFNRGCFVDNEENAAQCDWRVPCPLKSWNVSELCEERIRYTQDLAFPNDVTVCAPSIIQNVRCVDSQREDLGIPSSSLFLLRLLSNLLITSASDRISYKVENGKCTLRV